MLTDAHTHLETFDPVQLEEILKDARRATLVIIITAGMSLESSASGVHVANAHKGLYAAVGVHPWNVTGTLDDETYETLRDLAIENEKVVAVSETGLDFARTPATRKEQMNVFRQHIRLAREVNKPLIVHCRNAAAELVRISKEEKASEVGVAIHGFAGTAEVAKGFLDSDFYISIGRALIRPENEALREVARWIPIDRLLIETNTSPGYGARGTPLTGPSSVREVALKLAELKGLSLEDVGLVTTQNLRRLIGVWY